MAIPNRLMRLVPSYLWFVASCNLSNDPSLDQLVGVGTHRLYIHCLGSGRPTIVIGTGVADAVADLVEQFSGKLGHGTHLGRCGFGGWGKGG